MNFNTTTKKVGLISGVVIAVVCIIAGSYFLIRNSSTDTSSENAATKDQPEINSATSQSGSPSGSPQSGIQSGSNASQSGSENDASQSGIQSGIQSGSPQSGSENDASQSGINQIGDPYQN